MGNSAERKERYPNPADAKQRSEQTHASSAWREAEESRRHPTCCACRPAPLASLATCSTRDSWRTCWTSKRGLQAAKQSAVMTRSNFPALNPNVDACKRFAVYVSVCYCHICGCPAHVENVAIGWHRRFLGMLLAGAIPVAQRFQWIISTKEGSSICTTQRQGLSFF